MFAPLKRGYLTQGFKTTHRGIDIGWISYLIFNPPVFACKEGVVVESKWTTLGGNVIALRHDVGADHYYLSRYVHLKERKVALGDKVTEGQPIGIGGSTGNSTGPHLHFEIWVCPNAFVYKGVLNVDRDKYAVDPRLLISTDMKGEGFRMVNITPSNMPTALTIHTEVRYRESPSLKGIVIGALPIGTKFPYLGKTQIIDGYVWAKLLVNERIVYAAINYLIVNEPTREVIKEVVKTVESAIDSTVTLSNGIVVSLKRPAGEPK